METVPFETWKDVLAYARTGGPLYYQAPLDRLPTHLIPAEGKSPVPYTYKVQARTIRIWPPGSVGRGRFRTADPFNADSGHLARFSRPVEGGVHETQEVAAHREPADEHAATELVMYIENTSELSPDGPSGQGRSVLLNALRKWKKGTYDPERAVKLFEYLAEAGAKQYAKEFGEAKEWSTMFTSATRHEAAKQLEESFRNSAKHGEYDHVDTRIGHAREVEARPGRVQTPRLDSFTRSYFETALWSSTDKSTPQGGEPLDENYSVEDIAPETRAKMIADCADFQDRYASLLAAAENIDSERAGHNFWLSRNGHGAGFFDDDLNELQDAAESYGEFNLYVGDDGQIHGS